MSTWNKLESQIQKAIRSGYKPTYQPFKDGDKVGHNSHYRFVWLASWWVALFGEEAGEDFILKAPTKARLMAHKALEVALDRGPNAMIEFTQEQLEER